MIELKITFDLTNLTQLLSNWVRIPLEKNMHKTLFWSKKYKFRGQIGAQETMYSRQMHKGANKQTNKPAKQKRKWYYSA